MIFVLPTIQHTGTFFMLRQIFAGMTKLRLRDEPHVNSVVYDHTWPGHRKYFEWWLSEWPGITPLRSPERIIYSWERKHRPLEKLEQLIDEWLYLVDRFDIDILPIDHTHRDYYLNLINEKHDVEFTTDWRIEPSGKDQDPFGGEWTNISERGVELADRLTDFYPPPGLNGRSVAA